MLSLVSDAFIGMSFTGEILSAIPALRTFIRRAQLSLAPICGW